MPSRGDELRQQFPLKTHDIFARSQIAAGLVSLRNLYLTRGYVDFVAIPNTQLSSAGIANLTIEVEEGPQYHMKSRDCGGERNSGKARSGVEAGGRGAVYDQPYIDEYLISARDILPSNFSRANVETALNCPEALVQIRLIVDPAQDTSNSQPKNVPCQNH